MTTENLISVARAASVLRTNVAEIKKLVALNILTGRVDATGLYSVKVDLKLEQEMHRRRSKTIIEELLRESRRGHCSTSSSFMSSLKKSENNIEKPPIRLDRKIENSQKKSLIFSKPCPKPNHSQAKTKRVFEGKRGEMIPILLQSKDRKFLELYRESFFSENSQAGALE